MTGSNTLSTTKKALLDSGYKHFRVILPRSTLPTFAPTSATTLILHASVSSVTTFMKLGCFRIKLDNVDRIVEKKSGHSQSLQSSVTLTVTGDITSLDR